MVTDFEVRLKDTETMGKSHSCPHYISNLDRLRQSGKCSLLNLCSFTKHLFIKAAIVCFAVDAESTKSEMIKIPTLLFLMICL